MSVVEAYYDGRRDTWRLRINGVPLSRDYPTKKRASDRAREMAKRNNAVLRVLTQDGDINLETAKYRLTW